MENEIGEYGRTNLGKIIKFAWLEDEKGKKYENKVILVDLMLKETYPYYYFKKGEYIVKHSPNLIDLIRVGDMVHTRDVLNEDWYWMFDEEMVKATKETIEEGIDLVEIVTKEMMESISYKVERED